MAGADDGACAAPKLEVSAHPDRLFIRVVCTASMFVP
jgi:hypothetical protein